MAARVTPTGMIAVTMRPRRVGLMALPLVILAASQAGHLLAWQLRQGPQALPVVGSGAHGYVPALTTVTFGTAGVAVLAALCVIGAARAARLGRAVLPAAPAPRLRRIPVLDATAFLFVLQLAVYLAQETVEAAWAGFARPGFADLLLWGSLGQVPVAIVAGAALSWLSIHFEAAVEELMNPVAALPLSPRPAAAPPRVGMRRAPLTLPIQVSGGAFSERGPP
jgi:hypothetical protein